MQRFSRKIVYVRLKTFTKYKFVSVKACQRQKPTCVAQKPPKLFYIVFEQHSSTKTRVNLYLTYAISSIPWVSYQTCAVIRSFGVGTVSIIMTNVCQVLVLRGQPMWITFVDILSKINGFLCQGLCEKLIADHHRQYKAAGKRTQHCWPTTSNIVGCYLLRPFANPVVVGCCCVFFRKAKSFKLLARCHATLLGVVSSVCT